MALLRGWNSPGFSWDDRALRTNPISSTVIPAQAGTSYSFAERRVEVLSTITDA
jgi:hypothetical protein